ncbi:DUF4649 family protein [Streptococcus sp. H49]|uniref:DUF4649 family protein n=1 Tax=Streptococcus huangxiaojuni TaxID=3237239 RepID=UPI0034A3C71A
MIEIIYLDAANQERTVSYPSYEEFKQSQQTNSTEIADYYKIVKLTYKGQDLNYSGTYGDIFFYLQQQNLPQDDV